MPVITRDEGVRSLVPTSGERHQLVGDGMQDLEHDEHHGSVIIKGLQPPPTPPRRTRSSTQRFLHVDLSQAENGLGQATNSVLRRGLAVCMVCAAVVALNLTSRAAPRDAPTAAADSHNAVGLLGEAEPDVEASANTTTPNDWGQWAIYIRGAGGLCLDSYQSVHMEACQPDRASQQWSRSPTTSQLRNWNGRCLDTAHPNEVEGEVHMWDCDSTNPHQRWEVNESLIGTVKGSQGLCLLSTGDILSPVTLGMCGGKNWRRERWGMGAITWTLGGIPATRDEPSLFCWQVANASEGNYEMDIIREAFKRNVGIFACNAWVLFTEEQAWLQKEVVQTSALPGQPEPFSTRWARGIKWIMNSDIFIRSYLKIKLDGRYLQHDWVVKVDPDAAFFSDRLRHSLAPKTKWWTGAKYVMNCGAFNSMQGPLEVISKEAMTKLADGVDGCRMDPSILLGEDYFLQHCLDRLGVGSLTDYDMLYDTYCGQQSSGPWKPMDCASMPQIAAMHPLKTTWEMLRCYAEVIPSTKVVQGQIL